MFSDFETERSGKNKESQKATQDIRSTVQSAYSEQLKTNAPTRMYVIQIDPQNHGQLFTSAGSTPTDLGLLSANVSSRVAIINQLSSAIKSSSLFPGLFAGKGNTKLSLITFSVIFAGQPIAQFGLEPTP